RAVIAVVDFSRDLVAHLDLFEYFLLVGNIVHGHSIHPAFDLLPVHREGLVSRIDLLNLTFENVFLLCPTRSILVLFGVAARQEQTKHPSQHRDSLHLNLHILSVGPTVRIASVRRFAASFTAVRSPHAILSVGPTVRIASVHRFAASLLASGPPRLPALNFTKCEAKPHL